MATHGKFVVITGATRGIGRALTIRLAALGHRVAGCGRRSNEVEQLRVDPGPPGLFDAVDVTDRPAVEAWARTVLAHGVPDLLINNAGTINADARFCDVPPDEFERVLSVNVLGVANVMRAFLPAMTELGRGVIVNISSGAGVVGFGTMSAYCASKFAIEGLSKSIAKELPEGMAIIPLQPGVINTELLQLHYGKERAESFDTPDVWVDRAVPYILGLGPEHNGSSLRIPDA
jgi:NAD(P)-dependent dehydrogenase (short-subunit alcohol dehydrogenase family)